MSLRLQCEEMLAVTLEDETFGFGWPATIRNHITNDEQTISCQQSNISESYDVDSGEYMLTQTASITVRLSTLTIGFPKSGWKVSISDITGTTKNFRVKKVMPDKELGLAVLMLEIQK